MTISFCCKLKKCYICEETPGNDLIKMFPCCNNKYQVCLECLPKFNDKICPQCRVPFNLQNVKKTRKFLGLSFLGLLLHVGTIVWVEYSTINKLKRCDDSICPDEYFKSCYCDAYVPDIPLGSLFSVVSTIVLLSIICGRSGIGFYEKSPCISLINALVMFNLIIFSTVSEYYTNFEHPLGGEAFFTTYLFIWIIEFGIVVAIGLLIGLICAIYYTPRCIYICVMECIPDCVCTFYLCFANCLCPVSDDVDIKIVSVIEEEDTNNVKIPIQRQMKLDPSAPPKY
jgi:hypothetical protein